MSERTKAKLASRLPAVNGLQYVSEAVREGWETGASEQLFFIVGVGRFTQIAFDTEAGENQPDATLTFTVKAVEAVYPDSIEGKELAAALNRAAMLRTGEQLPFDEA